MTVDAFCTGIEATVTEILDGYQGQDEASHLQLQPSQAMLDAMHILMPSL